MLKFIGRDNVRLYEPLDSLPKPPQGGGLWQDSAWLHWWDYRNGTGGVHRIGHEYNNPKMDGPQAALWSNLVTPAGIYKRVVYQPLRSKDKFANGWGCGDDTCRVEFIDNQMHWTVDDPEYDVSATLVVRDYHEPFNGFPNSGNTASEVASHHIDVGGAVSGAITMQGQTFIADGTGVRDHGWGYRDLSTMRSHRYFSATFGRHFSFVAWAFQHNETEKVEMFGWVMRDDTAIFPTDIDMVTYMEVDSASTRGGRIVLTLPDGEIIDCELIADAPGLMNYFHNTPCLNTPCRAVWNGHVGNGALESSSNFYRGVVPPGRMQRGLVKNGFYPAATVEALERHAANPFALKRTL